MKRESVKQGATKIRVVESESSANAGPSDDHEVSLQLKDWGAQVQNLLSSNSRHCGLAQDLLAKHPAEPLVALWTVLNDEALYCLELAMAIINDSMCGVNRSTTCHKWLRTSYVEKSIHYIFNDRSSIPSKRLLRATPIIMAASACRPDLVEALVAAGANVNHEDDMGMTALHYAAENSDSRSIEAVVTQFNIVSPYSGNISPLGLAALKGCIDTVKLLHTKGFDVNDDTIDSPLYCAVRGGNVRVVAYFLQNGAHSRRPQFTYFRNAYFIQPQLRYYPIHFAAKFGHLDIAKVLIENGAEVDKQYNEYNSDGRTPLHFAAERRDLPLVKYLVSEGADVNVTDRAGNVPLNVAMGDIADIHPDVARCASTKAVIDFLIFAGADIKGPVKSPLLSATLSNNPELVEYFAVLGLNVNQEYAYEYKSCCALHSAAIRGFVEVAEILLRYGAKLEDSRGRTAMRIAIECSHLPLVKLLVSNGATFEGKSVHSFMQYEERFKAVNEFLLAEFS